MKQGEHREPAKSFRDLIVWQKSHQLALAIYKASSSFPKEEIFGLTSQIRRSSVSVAANIAEAFKKRSNKDKVRILNISQGSLSETEYFLMLAHDLQYVDTSALKINADEVGRILEGYIKSIKNSSY
ncbi:MAG: four helix bundle protein [Cyclobacteriaceae bacterium]|nr:four helix bundle protein [Cyclobacteriaceae bacterium]MBX2957422.1 four helix bundle protein [Cyclobacteriaceae bacterium]